MPVAGSWNRDLCGHPPRARALSGNEHTGRDVVALKCHLEVGPVGVSVISNAGVPALPRGYFHAWFYDGCGDSRGRTRAVITVSGKDESRVFWALLSAKEPSPQKASPRRVVLRPTPKPPPGEKMRPVGSSWADFASPSRSGEEVSWTERGVGGRQMTRKPSARPVVSSWHLADQQR